ncbi:MAG TPA: response regulator transcription factor [Pseudogracilibacillus sp.]|nr:response regulator transcription factor [Pseudogracilibacillus sp.]
MERTILIVEDEPAIVTLIKYNVEKAGYKTDVAYNGEDAMTKVFTNEYDLIILDLMLPKMDGMEVCQKIRSERIFTPILMLTAKGNEHDRVRGLQIGADDYLTKPFSPKELVARIQAILRRVELTDQKQAYNDYLQVGDIKVFPDRFEAYQNDTLIELTRKEFDLLVYFVKNKGKILSRKQLLHAVWEFDFLGDTRTVDVQVSHLRDKIEANTKSPRYIKTVRGFGYKLEDPNEQ